MLDVSQDRGVKILTFRIEEGQFAAEQSRVADRLNFFRRKIEKSNPACAALVDVIPKRSGKIHALEIVKRRAPLLDQDFNACGNCAFGQCI